MSLKLLLTWHESFPPAASPAQIWVVAIVGYFFLQSNGETKGIVTSRKLQEISPTNKIVFF